MACLTGATIFPVLMEAAARRTGDTDGTDLDLEVGQILRGDSFKGHGPQCKAAMTNNAILLAWSLPDSYHLGLQLN